jgi:hypothetical protein
MAIFLDGGKSIRPGTDDDIKLIAGGDKIAGSGRIDAGALAVLVGSLLAFRGGSYT